MDADQLDGVRPHWHSRDGLCKNIGRHARGGLMVEIVKTLLNDSIKPLQRHAVAPVEVTHG